MSDEPKPKIIIDEDWKSRAQAEKEALAREAALREPETPKPGATVSPEATSREAASAARAASATASGATAAGAAGEIPPASFPMFLTTLATQAMVTLGQIANPVTGKAEVDLPYARHLIDTLQMLEEKTRGNLTPDESGMLSDLLHDLRLTYVAVRDQPNSPR
jgi:hypothetical protein